LEDNIKMDLREIGLGWYILDSSASGWGLEEGCCEYGNEYSGSMQCCETLGYE
jgi:hypothetical protein